MKTTNRSHEQREDALKRKFKALYSECKPPAELEDKILDILHDNCEFNDDSDCKPQNSEQISD